MMMIVVDDDDDDDDDAERRRKRRKRNDREKISEKSLDFWKQVKEKKRFLSFNPSTVLWDWRKRTNEKNRFFHSEKREKRE